MKKLNQTGTGVMGVLSALFLFCFSLSAVADNREGKGDVEKIDVIGSHIKRTNVEGPSPVLVITREDIDMSGYNSLSDVLRDLPIASFGGGRETSLGYPASTSSTSLRGQTSGNILVLINYRRVAPVGGDNYVNLNTVPLSAVDKIEILKDGSPAYGADAVGGVINVVTKKNQTGWQMNVQGTLVQRKEGNKLSSFASLFDFWNWDAEDDLNAWNGKGDKLSVSASYGGNTNDIDYLVGAQVRLNSSMYLSDRGFGRPEAKHQSIYGPIGNWADSVEGAKGMPLSDCPSESIVEKSTGKWCMWDFSPYMQFMPRILQGSLFAQAETNISDRIRLSSTALYDYTNSWSQLAPPPLVSLKLPVDTAKQMGLPATGTEDIPVYYRPLYEKGTGPRRTSSNIHSYQLQLVGGIDLMDTMELESALNFSGSHFLSESEGLLQAKPLFDLVKKGEVNFKLPKDKKGDMSTASHTIFKGIHSNIISFEPKLIGEMVQTETQSLSYAVGGLGAWQRYSTGMDEESQAIDNDDNDFILGGDVIADGVGDRWFGGIYGELSLMSFDMLEANLIARTDYYYYSDSEDSSGFTEQVLPFTEDWVMPISPRLALSFQPIEEVKLRASWGLGFKAPALESIYQKETTAYPFSIDYKLCPVEKYDKNNNDCAMGQHPMTVKGVTSLKPETFQSLNMGLVLQPVDLFSLSADYFMIKRKNVLISPFSATRNILLYESKHGAESLAKHGVIFKRSQAGSVESITTSPFNGQDESHGLDLTVDFSMPVGGAWDLGLTIEHIHMLYQESSIFEGAVDVSIPWHEWLTDLLGLENADPSRPNTATYYGSPRWRNRAILSVMNKNMGHKLDLVVHNIPGQGTVPESKTDETDHYWQLDLVGGFTLNKQTSLIVGVRNIFDTERPENKEDYRGAGYINSALYSIRGRAIDARLTHHF